MRHLATALLVLLSFSALAADAPRVAALAEKFDNPTLGAAAPVSNVTLKLSDRMSVTLTSGNAAPVMAGQDTIGLFFSGSGTFSYRADDKSEAVNVKHNARKASDFRLTDGDAPVVSTEFKQMYLRSAGITLPQLAGTGENLGQQFNDLRAELKQRFTPATHLLIKQRIDHPNAAVAVAEFAGGQATLYVLDTIETRTESLNALRKENRMGVRELIGYWWPVAISEAPVGRPSRRGFLEPLYLLTDVDYTLVETDKESATLTVTETIMPRIAPQSAFRFDLHSNVYDTAGKARNFNVRSVTDASGKELSYDHKNGSIIVGLPQKAAVNQPIKLKFEIEGDFLFHQAAYNVWQLGTSPWFPQPDLNGQYYTIHSLVKVKKPHVAFIPGTTVREGVEGAANEYNVVETKIDKPVMFSVAHGGKYHVYREVFDDGNLTVRVASYGLNKPAAAKQLATLAWKMIKNYEPWLGPFPFKEFNIIEIPELGFAQAPPGTMFITKEAFNPTMGEDNKAFSRGINERFAHEIAHQYWGQVVKMGSFEEQWVTESFAEYSSALLMKNLKKGAYEKMLAHWKANASDATEVSSIALANRIRIASDPGAGFRARTYLIYDKGAYLLAAIHKEIGEDKFLTFMRSLQGIFAWQFLTTPDMAKLLQRIEPSKDWAAFFDQYYYGTEMPKL